MAKCYGKIGYGIISQKEEGSDIWIEQIVEKPYIGEIQSFKNIFDKNENSTNEDITLNSSISIIADSFAFENMSTIKYVTYGGIKWRITNISPQYPRLIVQTGGLYINGQ